MREIKGKKSLALGVIKTEDNRYKDYMLYFLKGDQLIARMYYHLSVKQVILETEIGVGLTKETLDSMMLYYNFKTFQLQRKLIQSYFRRKRNAV